jgi:hypothetical protein
VAGGALCREICAVKGLVDLADIRSYAADEQDMIVKLSWFAKAKKWMGIRVQ